MTTPTPARQPHPQRKHRAYLTKWERSLLSSVMSAYQSADFNCGASEDEMMSVSCLKVGNNDVHLNMRCGSCKFYERFEKMMGKF